jgi:hypothetical protein
MRLWIKDGQLSHLTDGTWGPMYDDHGNRLAGIEGKCGVRAQKADGTWIGGDFVRMQPHAAFPLHTHEGEHVIYFIYGSGFVHINGKDVPVRTDQLIHIPAEYPHSVWCAEQPLMFLAVGHPHQQVHSLERMTVCVMPDDDTARPTQNKEDVFEEH